MKMCAIVDAYSSGNLLAPAFARQGYKTIHVRSKNYALPMMMHSFHKDDFYLDIPASNADTQAAVLKENKVEFIVAGCEVGVELADLLSEKLELPGNGTVLSTARRNKYEMIEVIRKAGLRAAKQTKSSSLATILDFVRILPEYDVILKPQRSAGKNLVFQAHNEREVRLAFEKIMSHKTIFDEDNTEVCVQERLRGEEFIVDTVSSGGRHLVTDIWRYHLIHSNGVPFLYDRTELLDFSDPQLEPIKKYTLEVIDALGIKWGPAHPEIILTKDGPVVIEVGARLAGAKFPAYVKAAIGESQVDATVDAYCNPKSFETARHNPYSLKTRCVLVSLISHTTGRLKSLAKLQEIEKLASFFQTDIWVRPEEIIYKTVDVVTSPGIIALMHKDISVIERDCAAIRLLERDGLYEVEA
jgi:biotin carboxylase